MRHYTDKAWGRQNVFRTISVGFQPYLPFTQAYTMELRQQAASMQGASNRGYFTLQPEDRPGLGEDERDGYPWVIRRQTYMAEGDGRLAYMSRLMDREERALEAANDIRAQASGDILGERLSNIIGGRIQGPLQQYSTRVSSELELGFLERMFQQEGVAGMSSPRLNRSGSYERAKDFDTYLEDHDTFKQFLSDTLGTTLFDDQHTTSFELEDRQTETGHKILSHVNTANMTVAEARVAWATHIQTEVDSWNQSIAERWLSNSNIVSQGNAQYDYQLARNLFEEGHTSGEEYEIRQFLNRMQRNVDQQLLNSLARPAQHIVSNQLGNNLVGFARFFPIRDSRGIPQIGWDGMNASTADEYEASVMVLRPPDGRIITAFAQWADVTVTSVSFDAMTLLSDAIERAAGVATATNARLLARGTFMGTNMTSAIMDSIDVEVDWAAGDKIHLTSTGLAEHLQTQFDNLFYGGQYEALFADWYADLMEESNKLTSAWHAAVGPGPVNGWPISTEFQFGDDAGNPRKHYLGVWNKEDEDAWRNNDVGYNFSISPLVMSRRAGGVLFK